jgi:hypothetical protein
MFTEPAGVLWFIAATVLAPGLWLLLLAAREFTTSSQVASQRLQRLARRLGLTFVVLTLVLALYLLPVLLEGSRGGGLGSMGDPLGAFLILGYVFVLAPLAVLTAATISVVYGVRKRRTGGKV